MPPFFLHTRGRIVDSIVDVVERRDIEVLDPDMALKSLIA